MERLVDHSQRILETEQICDKITSLLPLIPLLSAEIAAALA